MKATPMRVGVALVVVALAIQVFFTWRWQQRASDTAAQWHALLREEREAQRRLKDLERESRLRAGAMALVGQSAATLPTDAALQKIRSFVVSSLGGHRRARLEVRPGPSPALATVALSTAGEFGALVELISTLTRPGTGLVLERASLLRDGQGGVSLNAEALALGTGAAP